MITQFTDFFSQGEVSDCNKPGAYSKLAQIEAMRSKEISDYGFMLEYPELNGKNIWLQSKSPLTTSCSNSIAIKCINCTWTNCFGALRDSCYKSPGAFLSSDSRTTGLYWYAIGAYSYSDRIPGPVIESKYTPVNIVKLYVLASFVKCPTKRAARQFCVWIFVVNVALCS